MKKVAIVLVIFALLVVFFRFAIGNILIRNFGVCAEAKIINETRTVKYEPYTWMYVFQVDGKNYKGNSNIEVGKEDRKNEIYILYVPFMPSINKVARGKGDNTCDCLIN